MITSSVRGIDVSTYQKNIDWSKVAKDGVQFAILKATQGRSVTNPDLYLFCDSTFEKNAVDASECSLALGAYHYLTATTEDEAIREANYFLSVIRPHKDKLTLGAAVDVEDSRLPKDKARLTRIVRLFCETVASAGFVPLIYTNPNFLKHRLGDVSDIGLWLALWRDKKLVPSTSDYPNLRIWQWGQDTCAGVRGACDANFGDEALLKPQSERYADAVCARLGFADTTRAYLSAYRFADALWERLYFACIGGDEK